MSSELTPQKRIQIAKAEMSATHKERTEHIHAMWVALVARLHLLFIGPGGTGKSMLVRDLVDRITDAVGFELALDETSDPGEVYGPPDIKGMIDDRVMRRITTGMAPEAHIWFLDEFFNASGPVLHKIMPALNERLIHNPNPTPIPLISCFMGTNKLNADADIAALWDRVHIRTKVGYVADRQNRQDLVREAMLKRIATFVPPERKGIITLDELAVATDEAYALPIGDKAEEMFYDIHEELLGAKGIEIGTRRMVEGMATVLANAWVNGHDEVKVADLEILQHVWWKLQADIEPAREVVLAATNPGEAKALELLDELDKFRSDLHAVLDGDHDPARKNNVGVEVFGNCERLLEEARPLLEQALASGASTTRLNDLTERTKRLQAEVGEKVFGLKAESMVALAGAKR